MVSCVIPVADAEWEARAAAAGIRLPLEQTTIWDRFDEAMEGRSPFGHYVWISDGQDRAFLSLSKLTGRGFTYLWAKHGPEWVSEPTAGEEAQLRADLRRELKGSRCAFVRLHAHHRHPELRELLQSVTFDRTVILDLTKDEETLLAEMKKRGRRDVRKALRNEEMSARDETGAPSFAPYYRLLTETGARDGFGISSQSTYETMLNSLGEHARLFAVRAGEELLCWGIVTRFGPRATYYYAASSARGRKLGAPDLLVWEMTRMLREEGVEEFDLMGIDSDRAPQLAGVTGFKTKFSEEIHEVPGAWDYPLHPLYYAGLVRALAAKRGAVRLFASAKDRLRKSRS